MNTTYQVQSFVELLAKSITTDSITKREQLQLQICNQCYSLLKDIASNEKNTAPEMCLVATWFHDYGTPVVPSEYTFYQCKNNAGDDCLCIVQNYSHRKDQDPDDFSPFQIKEFYIPYYVINDIKSGLAAYHQKKYASHQKELRDYIAYNLRQIKNKIKDVKDIPDDFKKIIDDNFWEMI